MDIAETTDAAEQFDLGDKYYHGEGVPQDYEKAAYWFTKSAEQGHDTAQRNLMLLDETANSSSENAEEQAKLFASKAVKILFE